MGDEALVIAPVEAVPPPKKAVGRPIKPGQVLNPWGEGGRPAAAREKDENELVLADMSAPSELRDMCWVWTREAPKRGKETLGRGHCRAWLKEDRGAFINRLGVLRKAWMEMKARQEELGRLESRVVELEGELRKKSEAAVVEEEDGGEDLTDRLLRECGV